ncbi:MAG: hypothetical protein R2789_15010 [Microthrixaceae bacterium]
MADHVTAFLSLSGNRPADDRPCREAHALSIQVCDEMSDALDALAVDESVSVVIGTRWVRCSAPGSI